MYSRLVSPEQINKIEFILVFLNDVEWNGVKQIEL